MVGALSPRLVDVAGAGKYLGGLSPDVVRELDGRVLRRVRLPGSNGRDLNRVLFDVQDLDELIERSKDTEGGTS